MAGLNKGVPQPTDIKLHRKSRIFEISFADGKTFRLPCEFLRVYSPSAEVRGHGPGQEEMWRHYLKRMEEAGASREPQQK